jgi:hypothetical protein
MKNITINKFVLLNMVAQIKCNGCALLHECEKENRDALFDREEEDIFPSTEQCLNLWLKCSGTTND